MEKKINEREIRINDIKLREASDSTQDENYYILEGLPIVFNKRTCLGKDYWTDREIYEEISDTAFDEADLSDVVFNVNHGDGNHAVARTRNGTLTLTKQNDGMHCVVKLSKNNPRCVQVYEDVREGLLDKMSFAFTIDEQSFSDKESCYFVRKVGKVFDVSAVEHPAYDSTFISARRKSELEAVAKREQAVAKELIELRKSIINDLSLIK